MYARRTSSLPAEAHVVPEGRCSYGTSSFLIIDGLVVSPWRHSGVIFKRPTSSVTVKGDDNKMGLVSLP